MYTSKDVRGSVSSIHERAHTAQQFAQETPGAHTSYRRPQRTTPGISGRLLASPSKNKKTDSAPIAPIGADDLRSARAEIGALLRRLDYLLSCQPPPSPALTYSLLCSMRREARAVALALALDGQEGADATALIRPERRILSVPDLTAIPQEGAPC